MAEISKIQGTLYGHVDTDGNIYSKHGELYKKRKTQKNNRGYHRVWLVTSNKKQRAFLVHRLVAEAFISNPRKLETVNHINGDKDDNSVKNLEWMTMADNVKHAFNNGLSYGRSRNRENDIDIIREYSGKWGDITKLSIKYGISHATVTKIVGSPYENDEHKRVRKLLKRKKNIKHGDIAKLSRKYNMSKHYVRKYLTS